MPRMRSVIAAVLVAAFLTGPARASHVSGGGTPTVSVAAGDLIYTATPALGINAQFTVRRLAADGGVVWEVGYGRGRAEEATAIAATPDGGVVVAGANKDGCFIARWDSQGRLVWEGTPTNRGQCRPAGVVVDGEASSYLLATIEGSAGFDAMTWKFGPKGDQVWSYRYASNETLYAQNLYLDPRGDRLRAFVLRKHGTEYVEEFFRLDLAGRKL